MKALINTLNLTINIHRDSPESTSHDKADLAEFLMAMSQMELFPDCDEAIAEPTQPADSMDFNTPTQPADSMDFNTLHADRLQEKICMRLTDNYRAVGQAIDDSRLKDKQASVIDACRSAISEDTKVLVPENSWIFHTINTSAAHTSLPRRWVNYYTLSGNYGATAYSTEQEAREQSTDSSQAVVQVPFIEFSVELLRGKLDNIGVTFN